MKEWGCSFSHAARKLANLSTAFFSQGAFWLAGVSQAYTSSWQLGTQLTSTPSPQAFLWPEATAVVLLPRRAAPAEARRRTAAYRSCARTAAMASLGVGISGCGRGPAGGALL